VKTRITELLNIEYPIIQAGMSWASSCSALPLAVSNAGGLGVLAAGPMFVDHFIAALEELHRGTDRPYAVNIPLYRPQAEEILSVMERRRVPVVIASQGGPRKHVQRFRDAGAKWFHVVSTLEHARKAEDAGVDAVIVVGAEAGGHPPADGVGTLVTVRRAVQALDIPVIAGGGVADGAGVAALLALGAQAVQLGTRFILTPEASVHPAYKAALLATEIDGTTLVGRRTGLPVRMLANRHAHDVLAAEMEGMAEVDYLALLARSSLKLAALDGDVEIGKVEAGQSVGLVGSIKPAADVMRELVEDLHAAAEALAAVVRAGS